MVRKCDFSMNTIPTNIHDKDRTRRTSLNSDDLVRKVEKNEIKQKIHHDLTINTFSPNSTFSSSKNCVLQTEFSKLCAH